MLCQLNLYALKSDAVLFGVAPKWLLSILSASDCKQPNSAKQIGSESIGRTKANLKTHFSAVLLPRFIPYDSFA